MGDFNQNDLALILELVQDRIKDVSLLMKSMNGVSRQGYIQMELKKIHLERIEKEIQLEIKIRQAIKGKEDEL